MRPPFADSLPTAQRRSCCGAACVVGEGRARVCRGPRARVCRGPRDRPSLFTGHPVARSLCCLSAAVWGRGLRLEAGLGGADTSGAEGPSGPSFGSGEGREQGLVRVGRCLLLCPRPFLKQGPRPCQQWVVGGVLAELGLRGPRQDSGWLPGDHSAWLPSPCAVGAETTEPPFQKDRCCRSLPLSPRAVGPLRGAVCSGLGVPMEELTCASGELLGCPRWGAGRSAPTGLPTERQELDERPRPGASNPRRLRRVVEFCFVSSLRHEDLPQKVESRRYGDSFGGCLSCLEPVPLCS